VNATLTWDQGLRFACDNRGIATATEATPEHGGQGLAPTPKELLLNAMMGCTAIDVVSILRKMRQEFSSFAIDGAATQNDVHPIHFVEARLTFRVSGTVLPEKLIKAVEASLTKYCGVNYMVSKTCDIRFSVFLNDREIHSGAVAFTAP
jgi:putative redox protein